MLVLMKESFHEGSCCLLEEMPKRFVRIFWGAIHKRVKVRIFSLSKSFHGLA